MKKTKITTTRSELLGQANKNLRPTRLVRTKKPAWATTMDRLAKERDDIKTAHLRLKSLARAHLEAMESCDGSEAAFDTLFEAQAALQAELGAQ